MRFFSLHHSLVLLSIFSSPAPVSTLSFPAGLAHSRRQTNQVDQPNQNATLLQPFNESQSQTSNVPEDIQPSISPNVPVYEAQSARGRPSTIRSNHLRNWRPRTKPQDTLPRVIVYQQTHHHDSEGKKPVSLLPLVEHGTGITHVYVAAVHINGPGSITLNDHPLEDPRHGVLWREVFQLQKKGIGVMLMIGGAAEGSYSGLCAQDERTFMSYYLPLVAATRRWQVNGVDLDVEEEITLSCVKRLIRALRADMGPRFIITLAPVYPSLLAINGMFVTPESVGNKTIPTGRLQSRSDSGMHQPRCHAKNFSKRSADNLSGFNYFELEGSDEGQMVNWYNLQIYCGWGNPLGDGAYESIINAGWRPERVVMGVITNPHHGSGFQPVDMLSTAMTRLSKMYAGRFGGVVGWEYHQAGSSLGMQPWQWVKYLGRALGKVEPRE